MQGTAFSTLCRQKRCSDDQKAVNIFLVRSIRLVDEFLYMFLSGINSWHGGCIYFFLLLLQTWWVCLIYIVSQEVLLAVFVVEPMVALNVASGYWLEREQSASYHLSQLPHPSPSPATAAAGPTIFLNNHPCPCCGWPSLVRYSFTAFQRSHVSGWKASQRSNK